MKTETKINASVFAVLKLIMQELRCQAKLLVDMIC